MNIGFSLLSLSSGIICGIVLSTNKKVSRIISTVFHYIIYVLLFFLGVKLASSPHFIENITSLGKQALIISLCCILGSCIAAVLVKKIFFKTNL